MPASGHAPQRLGTGRHPAADRTLLALDCLATEVREAAHQAEVAVCDEAPGELATKTSHLSGATSLTVRDLTHTSGLCLAESTRKALDEVEIAVTTHPLDMVTRALSAPQPLPLAPRVCRPDGLREQHHDRRDEHGSQPDLSSTTPAALYHQGVGVATPQPGTSALGRKPPSPTDPEADVTRPSSTVAVGLLQAGFVHDSRDHILP